MPAGKLPSSLRIVAAVLLATVLTLALALALGVGLVLGPPAIEAGFGVGG